MLFTLFNTHYIQRRNVTVVACMLCFVSMISCILFIQHFIQQLHAGEKMAYHVLEELDKLIVQLRNMNDKL